MCGGIWVRGARRSNTHGGGSLSRSRPYHRFRRRGCTLLDPAGTAHDRTGGRAYPIIPLRRPGDWRGGAEAEQWAIGTADLPCRAYVPQRPAIHHPSARDERTPHDVSTVALQSTGRPTQFLLFVTAKAKGPSVRGASGSLRPLGFIRLCRCPNALPM